MDVVLAAQPVCVFSPHPLLPREDRQLHYVVIEPGETIAAYLDRLGILARIRHRPAIVSIDHYRVPMAMLAHVRPKPGTQVHVQCVMHGGDGKNPIATVLSLGLMFVAPGLGAALGQAVGLTGTAFSIAGQAVTWGTILGGAISLVGNLSISALFPAPKPQLSRASFSAGDASPTYSITGGSNRARRYEPMPVIVGTQRVFPDLGAQPYTEFEGEDQVLYQVFDLGYNDVDLSSFRIGDNALDNYDGVVLEISGSDGKIGLCPGNVDSVSGATLEHGADWTVRTSSPDATALAIEITGTLFFLGDDGPIQVGVTLEMQYRAVGDADWTPWFSEGNANINSASRRPLRHTYWKQVPQGRYEVRVRRIAFTWDPDPQNAERVSVDIVWSQLRTYQPDTGDYTGRKRVGIKIRASGQLQGVVQQLSCVARAKTSVWNGASWVTAQTSNPAWWVLAAARGKFVNGRKMWGAGIADSRIGLDNLKAFGAWCAAQGLTVNGVFDQQITVQGMLDAIALRGRGTLTYGTGSLEVVWDAPAQPVVAVVGMANIMLDTFEIEYTSEQLADEVIAHFWNAETEQRDQVRVLAPGVSAPVRPRNLDLFLCNNAGEAGRDANLYLAANTWRTRRYRFRMDWEAMPLAKGDVAMLSHDLASYDYSGRLVEGSSASTLKLSRTVPLAAAGGFITIVQPNGAFSTHAVEAGAGDSDTLTLTDALDFDPGDDADHPPYDYRWLYGYTESPGRKIKIESIVPRGYDQVELTAIDETPEYYAAESDPYQHTAPRPVFGGAPELASLLLTEEGVRAATGYLVKVIATWEAAGDYDHADVRVSIDGGPLDLVGQSRGRGYEFLVHDGAAVTVEVTAYASLGVLGQSARASVSRTIDYAGLFPPSNVEDFDLDGGSFTWREAPDVDVVGYRIRYHYGINPSWGDAAALHTGTLSSAPYTPPGIPSGLVTFLIVAVDAAGRVSESPATLTRNLGDPEIDNVLEEFAQAPAWSGTRTDCSVDAGALKADDGELFWGADAAAFWQAQQDLFWPAAAWLPMSYACSIVPSQAAVGSTLTVVHAISGQGISIRYRRGSAPGPFWPSDTELFWGDDAAMFWAATPAYQPWPGAITAENEQWDFLVSIGGGGVRGIMTAFTPTVDVPDIEESFDDVDVPPEGERLTLTQPFHAVTNIQITLEDDGGDAVSARYLDKSTSPGPLIQCIDASQSGVAGRVDVRVKGY